MSLDQETSAEQQKLLAQDRQRLALLLQQQAKLGVHTPPHTLIDIQEAQSAIGRIKEQLRADGVPLADEPNDEVQPATFTPPSRLSPLEQRNRRAMLTKVKTIWIEGLLEQSLAKTSRRVVATGWRAGRPELSAARPRRPAPAAGQAPPPRRVGTH